MKEAKRNSKEDGVGSERRRSARYQIRGIAWFQWETEDGQSHQGTGVTRDVGKAGTFIETPARPPVGTRVKVLVTIGSDVKDEMQARLCGAGDVRHLQHDEAVDGGFGMWVSFHTEAASAG